AAGHGEHEWHGRKTGAQQAEPDDGYVEFQRAVYRRRPQYQRDRLDRQGVDIERDALLPRLLGRHEPNAVSTPRWSAAFAPKLVLMCCLIIVKAASLSRRITASSNAACSWFRVSSSSWLSGRSKPRRR